MKYIDRIKAHTGHILYHLWPGGKTILPSSVVLEFTNRCNLRCSMCWWDFQKSAKNGHKELTLCEFKTLIDELATFRPRLTITGSEPFMRKDAPEILEYIHEKKLTVDCIMTNGTLMSEEIAEAIVKTNPGMVQFSIDGDEDIHDQIRSMKGAYQRTVKGIEILKSAIEHDGKCEGIGIRLNCVISPQNLHCLNSVARLAKELGAQLQFQYLMWLDRDRINHHQAFMRNTLEFDDKNICNLYSNLEGLDLKILEEQIAEIRKFCNESGVPLFFMQFSDQAEIKMWYSDLNFIPRGKCLEPFLVSRIDAEGNVKFCPLIDYSYGNIKDVSFRVLWNNLRALKIRSLLRRQRLFPGCIRCCKL
ncbi:MAG: radical SAM protein [Candidatus Scalindua sp.]|jgi:MoaA/NifB/PqqE/SkfB family radical SAM enzyme|nr:radical SAM protein [Candidatus Scalindua sp.]MBT5305065.1 radical SAM protein [Candidatus Scalindua sp.]MBT6048056.1 radical SAM protein [Candidatus Scalindua sp.]MBT6563246.1 radical SAM protein [Candidatus Scalindua sp.]MBT7210643.1 radical SAM protein [Candidatus Scalindua sp.]